ncbi:MAG: acyltransferase family protein [Solobacterium sp.]|nr:acyltransferase family protein [Solobacterium sp.]
MNRRYHHIDLMEAIGILFVVIYHSTLYKYNFVTDTMLNGEIVIYYIRYFLRTILSTCVPIFFFVNGYLLLSKSYDLSKHIQRTKHLMMMPLWGLVLMPLYLLLDGQGISIKTAIINLLNITTEWGMNLFWFIGALIVIYIFFPALKALYDKDENSFLAFIVVMFILTFGIKLINQFLMFTGIVFHHHFTSVNYPLINMFIPIRQYGYSFVYFCIGGLAFRYEKKLLCLDKKKRNLIAICTIVCSCAFLFLIGVFYSRYVLSDLWDVVWEGYDTIPTFINVIAIYTLTLNINKGHKLIEYVSKNTLGIYLFHGLIIRATRPYLKSIEFLCNYPVNIIYGLLIVLLSLMITRLLKSIPIVRNAI